MIRRVGYARHGWDKGVEAGSVFNSLSKHDGAKDAFFRKTPTCEPVNF
jgi:hypothetical protein